MIDESKNYSEIQIATYSSVGGCEVKFQTNNYRDIMPQSPLNAGWNKFTITKGSYHYKTLTETDFTAMYLTLYNLQVGQEIIVGTIACKTSIN